MTVTIYPNGTGGTLGDELVTETELYTTGLVYYVHHSGDDTNVGTSRAKPWASLVHAIATVVSDDTVVLLDGHAETISAAQTISQDGLKIVGEGSDEGVPTVTLTSGLTDQSMLTLSGINIALGNIRFSGGSSQVNVAKVAITGVRSMVRGCYFECDAAMEFAALSWSSVAHGARAFDTKFVVTSTTTQPGIGLLSNGPTDCEMEAVTFDGGDVGFGGGGYVDLSALGVGSAPERLRCQQMRLLNGAGFSTGASTTGYIGIAEKSGGPSVQGFGRRLASGFRQTGDALLADTELYVTGDIFYVHYETGDDANSGTDELAPKKTIGSALSVFSVDCSFVVLLPGHDEPTSATITLPLGGTTIIGCGTSSGLPGCKIHSDSADPIVSMGQIGYLRNVWIYDVEAESGPSVLVSCSVDQSEVRGCHITPVINGVIGVSTDSSFITCRETRFESAGTAIAQRPSVGLKLDPSGPMTDIDVRECIFSNSEFGFDQFALLVDDEVTRLYAVGLTLQYGADARIDSDTTGLLNPETSSGSASVEW